MKLVCGLAWGGWPRRHHPGRPSHPRREGFQRGDTYDTGLLGTRAFFAGHGGRLGRLSSHRPEPGLEDGACRQSTTISRHTQSTRASPVSVALRRRCSDAVPPTRTLGILTTTPERPRFSARTQALCGRQALYDTAASWSHETVKASGLLGRGETLPAVLVQLLPTEAPRLELRWGGLFRHNLRGFSTRSPFGRGGGPL